MCINSLKLFHEAKLFETTGSWQLIVESKYVDISLSCWIMSNCVQITSELCGTGDVWKALYISLFLMTQAFMFSVTGAGIKNQL